MITFFIPIFNEEKDLDSFFAKLELFIKKTKINNNFIIIDDGSSDKSEEKINNFILSLDYKLKERIIFIKNNFNRGVGYSFKVALSKSDKEFIFFLPSDNDIEFKNLENLDNYKKLDLLMMYPINFEKYSKYRYLLSMLFRMIYCFTFDVRANYIQSPCLYRISKLRNINIISNRFGIWPEINVKLLRSNIIYAELPIIFKNKSIIDRTVSFKNFIEVTFNYLKLIYEIFINNKSKYKNVAEKKYL